MKERSSDKRSGGLPLPLRAVIIGCVSGLFSCAALTALLSLLLVKVDVADSGVAGLAVAAAALAAFIGGFFAARSVGRNGLLNGFFSAAALFAVITVIGLLSGAALSPRVAVKLLAMSVGGILGGIIGVNVRKKLK